MTAIRNHITLIGNIGSQTEITKFDNGSKVARFSLATDKTFRANNGKMKSDTEWHRIFAWETWPNSLKNMRKKVKSCHSWSLGEQNLPQSRREKRSVTEVELRHIIGL